MNNKLRLKLNGTFSIREGWLEKGINLVADNETCFSSKEAPIVFGLGYNMCKSLKYWLEASNISKTVKGKTHLTEFGQTLFNTDKYLEKDFSWWCIHANIASNIEYAAVFNSFYNLDMDVFDKDTLFVNLKEILNKTYGEISSEKSLESDISVLLKSYLAIDVLNPEDSLNCPLSKLNLISKDNKNYKKTSPNYHSLDYRAVYWCLVNCLDLDSKQIYNLEDIYHMNNNPLKIFNISKSSFLIYLNQMENFNLISRIKTAGINTITFKQILSFAEIAELE